MMAGAGVAPGRREEPVDSLAFERELIRLMQIPERR
jgi:hypothetical protein